MAITVDRHEDAQLIHLSGPLNIEQAAELKGVLLEVLASSPHVSIQLAGASSIDITIVQLLCAAAAHAVSGGVNFVIEGPLNEAISQSLSRTGILPILQSLIAKTQVEAGRVLAVSN
jgi:anti-anti-sigma factor